MATLLVLLAFIKLGANNRREVSGLEKAVQAGYVPMQMGLDRLQQGVRRIGFYLGGGSALQDELAAAKAENNRLSLDNMQLQEDAAEVERLRSLLNYQQTTDRQLVLETARVIARSPDNWYKIIIIDKGSANGIIANMAVVSPLGLVGKVVSTTSNSAQVWLITDREMAEGAILQETRDTKGIVEGMGNDGTLRMINIPYFSDIAVGQKVITSGLSENYPPGINIGTVQDVSKEANGIVLSAIISPSVNFDQLEEVMVVKQFSREVEKGGQGG